MQHSYKLIQQALGAELFTHSLVAAEKMAASTQVHVSDGMEHTFTNNVCLKLN